MKRPRRSNAIAYALYANAAVLAAILVVLLGRDRVNIGSSAFAAPPMPAPIAGGGGVYIMPCQFHPNVWGCYLLDTNRQTISAYEYRSGDRALVLTAARDFQYDLQLRNYNTYPAWYDVQKLLDDHLNEPRGNATTQPGGQSDRNTP
jgi:hypothetical protein